MTSEAASPIALVRSLYLNRMLIQVLARREVLGRYRGSALGLLWSFFHPLLMLAVYTFVFSVVFAARWPGGGGSKAEFALVLFAGLLVYNFFSECVNRASALVLSNPNYVTKVVFPLEALPVVTLLSAGFHASISLGVWFVFHWIALGAPPVTSLLFPILILPLVCFTLGLSWFLSSLGVYLRDVSQIVAVVTTALMFLSPIFYSIEIVPEDFRAWMLANPLTLVIEQVRGAIMWGRMPDWATWAAHLAVSMVVMVLGFAWFQKTRRGFGDVL